MTWSCPCNGCKKAQKVIIDQIIKDYRSCPNMIDNQERLYCSTWYRHDDCVRLMELLNNITKEEKYSLPEINQEVKEAIKDILVDPNMDKILKKMKD